MSRLPLVNRVYVRGAPPPIADITPPLAFSRVVCAGYGQGEVSVLDGGWKLGLNGNMCDAFMGRCGSWYFLASET